MMFVTHFANKHREAAMLFRKQLLQRYDSIMLSPKRTKFRKQQRGRMKGKALRGSTIAFGDFALQALEPCWITSRQIEAGRRAMTRYARRGGKLWIRIFSG